MEQKFLRKNLTYARNRLGKSMQDIADVINVKRQYIHKIETGKENKSLSQNQLLEISNFLGIDPDYFFKDIRTTISSDRLHFRSISIPNYIRDRAKIYAEDFILVCEYIKNFIEPLGLEFPHFDLDERCNVDTITSTQLHKAEIEEASYKVRRILGLGKNPISNMVRVLETSGVIICTAPDISNKVDAFCNDDILSIVVRNDSKSPVRCRFDLAHEFGHLILHKGVSNDGNKNSIIEKQANHFASCLLLPKETFIYDFPNFHGGRIPWNKLLSMKLKWKVSMAALIMRAYDLRLITDEDRIKAYKYISHKGWRTCEPADHSSDSKYIEIEQPELIRNAVTMIMNTHKTFLPSMKKDLGIHSKLLKTIMGMPEIPDEKFESTTPHLSLIKND